MRLQLVGSVGLRGMSKSHSSAWCNELCKRAGIVRNDMVATFVRGSVSSVASIASEWSLNIASSSSNRLFIACERRGRSNSSGILVIRYVTLSQPTFAASDVCGVDAIRKSSLFRWRVLVDSWTCFTKFNLELSWSVVALRRLWSITFTHIPFCDEMTPVSESHSLSKDSTCDDEKRRL